MSVLSEGFQNLQKLCESCRKISLINDVSHAKAMRTLQLEKIVEKMILHVHSTIVLINNVSNNMNELDVSLIANAARNIMECAKMYFYIAQRGLKKDEQELRYLIMYLNSIQNENDIMTKLGVSDDNFRSQLRCSSRQHTVEELGQLPSFQALTGAEQQQILSGRKAAFAIKSPGILDRKLESAIYNLLSNSVHGLFIGLGSNSMNGAYLYHNFLDAELLLTISILVSRIYVAFVVKDYLDLRKQLYRLLNDEDKWRIKECKCQNDLMEYVEQIKHEYENLWKYI